MKKYIITRNTNLLAIARDILSYLDGGRDAELWHPDWVHGSDFAAMDEAEVDEILSHDPPVTGFRITTAHNQWSGRNLFHWSVFPATSIARVDYPLTFYVALFIKRNIPTPLPAVLEIGVDFDTILGGMEIPKEERRQRRPRTTRVRVGGTK